MNGKPKIAQIIRTGSGRKQVISWMDAPDDVYYRSTETSRKTRRKIPNTELRRAARKPWRCLAPKYAAIIAALLPPVTPVSTVAAAAVGIPQLPASLPPQLTAQLTAAGQLPHPAAVSANLNLNSNMVTAASLASVHPLAAQLIAGNNSSSANSNSGSTNINNSSSSNKANSDLQVVILD